MFALSLSLYFSLFFAFSLNCSLSQFPINIKQPMTNNLSVANGKEKNIKLFWNKTTGNDCTFHQNKYFQTIKTQSHGSKFCLSIDALAMESIQQFFIMKMIPPLFDWYIFYWSYVKRKQASSVETLHFDLNLQKLRLLFQFLISFLQTASSLPIIKYVCSNGGCLKST